MPDETVNLHKLLIEAVTSSARIEVRVGGMEQSINVLRQENEKTLIKISESLEKLAAIQAHLSNNADQHQVLHKRIDDTKEELDSIEVLVMGMKSNCQGANHQELMRRVNDIERTLSALCESLRLVQYKIFGVPIWIALTGMILLGAISDLVNHYEWVKKWWP